MKAGKKQIPSINFWQVLCRDREKHSICIVSFAFVSILFSFLIVNFFHPEHRVLKILFALVLILQIIIGILMIKGYRVLARYIAITGLWLFFTSIGLLYRDTSGSVLAGYLMVMIVAGFSIGAANARRVFAISMVALAIFWFIDFNKLHLGTLMMPSPTVRFLIYAAIIFMGGVYLDYTLQNMTNNLDSSQTYERRYRALFDSSPDTVLVFDLNFVLIEANQMGAKLFSYPRKEMLGKKAADLFIEIHEIEEVAEELLKNRKVSAFEHQVVTKSGELIDVESLPTLVFDGAGNPEYFQIILRDVRVRKKFESTLLEYRQRYQAMFDQVEYAFFLLSLDLKIVAANPKASDLIALPLKDLINMHVTNFVAPEEHSAFREYINFAINERHLPSTHYTIVDDEGHRLWGETTISIVEDQNNQPIYIQWIVRNVTGQKKREQELESALNRMEALAMTDPLTGLRNRRSVQQFTMDTLENSWIRNTPVSLILLDVDLLKKINDQYGHQAGDDALIHVANTLREQKREEDAASRWAGDEFLIILPDTDLHSAELAAIRFRQHIESKILESGEQKFNVGVCLGVAGTESLPPDATLSLNLLIQLADDALYKAKDKGRGQVAVARPNQTNLFISN